VNRERLFKRLAQGALQNVAFHDMIKLVEGCGFRVQRVTGSHHVFIHPGIPEILNLQNVGGEAKPYQIRQFYDLLNATV